MKKASQRWQGVAPTIVRIAALALLYFACGKLGLLLAVPPGYATIVWPPSGIAVGALLMYGAGLWPGIFLGSFVLNAGLGGDFFDGSSVAWDTLLVAAAIAGGSTVQALVARALVVRFISLPLDLSRISSAVLLFALTGPLASLVAATVGTTALYASGAVAAGDVASNWMTWWTGDLLGIIIFLPLTLVLPGGTRRLSWRGTALGALPLASVLILLLPLGLTFYAWKATSQYIYDKSAAQFAGLAEENESALLHRLDSYEQALLGGLGFFRGSEEVKRDEWRAYVEALGLREHFPGINGIGYIANVPADRLEEFVASVRRSEPGFVVHPKTVDRPYFVIQFIEPIEINHEALGLNIGFEDNRVEAAELSRDTGDPAITKRILLVQDETKSPGFLLLHPMYYLGLPTETVQQRREALLGWVYAPFVGHSFMQELTQSQGKLLQLHVYDGDTESPDSLIYESDAEPTRSEGAFTVRKQLDVMQQHWTIVWKSTPEFDATVRSREPLLILVGGLLFTALFGVLLVVLARRAQTVTELVAKKTKEISASEERLKLLIQHTPAAVAMFDTEMRYIMTSERWIADYRLAGREIIGRTLYEVLSEDLNTPRWRGIFRRALAGETFSREQDSWIGPDGRPEWVRWAIHPWIDANGRIGGIVIFTEVITARIRADARTQILKEVATESVEAVSVNDIFKSVLERMCGYLSWHVGHAYVWDKERAVLVSSGIWHLSKDAHSIDAFRKATVATTFKPGVGLPGTALAEAKAIYVRDVATDPNFPRAALVPDLHLHAGIGIPVLVSNEVTAVLELYSEDYSELTQDEREFLELLCVQLSRVVERRRFEEALTESNELNNAVLSSADYMVIATDRDGKVLIFNEAAERKSGYSAEEIVGKQTPALWHDPQEIAERTRELSEQFEVEVEPSLRVFSRQVELAGSATGEWTFIRKDGSRFPVKLTVTPLKDESKQIVGFLGILEDITQQKQQDAALRASEETFRSAMQYAPTGMALVAFDGSWIKVNPALCDLLGYSEAEMLQMSFSSVAHPDDLDHCLEARREVMQGKAPSYHIEARYLHKSGRVVWILANVSLAYDENGDPKCFIAQIQDITERREMERMKSEFISVVSHELRTPLTSIRGSLGLVAGKMAANLPGPVNQLVGIALKNSERLILLINDILDMDKIATGNMPFEMKTERLAEIVEQAVEANRAYASGFGVKLETDIVAPDLQVNVDAARFAQVLANLLSNAAKFSPEGGTVRVRVARAGGKARASVQDFGKGIPDQFRTRIFGRFSQADSSVTREKGGTGLGLHISKQLIERMDGTIGFDSVEGQGSTFWVDLPELGQLDKVPTGSGDARPPVPVPREVRATKSLPRALHIEDDVDLSHMLAAALEGRVEIVTAPTLADALRELSEGRFDLIVLDIGLPDGSGLALLEQYEQVTEQNIPVVVLSASETVPAANVVAALVKSRVSEEKIIDTIVECIDSSTDHSEEDQLLAG